MANAIHFSNRKDVETAVDNAHVAVVDYWATWCGPCKMIAPAIEKLAAEYAGRAMVGKVDVDQLPDMAQEAGIMSIPCVIIFKDGSEVDRIVGASPYSVYAKAVDEALA